MYSEISRKDKTLRDYQQTAKEQIFAAWDECNNVMFQMPTGTGKTRLFTSIIGDIKTWSFLNSMDSKILIIAHRIELIEQISESLDKYKISHGVIAGCKERNLMPQVQVASIQTITHHTNLDIAESLHCDFVIIDEAHHSMANSYRKLWSLYPNAKKLGVTATPWRMNGSGFTSIYDKLILSKPIQEFIAEGWLAPYDYYSISEQSALQKDINSIDEFDVEGDYKISALERVIDNQKIRAQLLDSYLKLVKGKKGIIYSISRKHSDHICEQYRDAGINIVRIDSQTSRDERRLYVNRFKQGMIDIIVNVDIFSEGFDCPDIEFIQLARPTKSLVKYLQQVGRGLRPTSGKTKCIILDNVGVHSDFGLPDENRDWMTDFMGEEKVKTHHSCSSRTETIKETITFDEGTESMSLIESASSAIQQPKQIEQQKIIWSKNDEDLLKILVTDKSCPIDILETIFQYDKIEIQRKMAELGLGGDQE